MAGAVSLRSLIVLALVGAVGLAACAPQAPVAPDGQFWHTLYARPGWSGGAAVDLRAVGDLMLARGVARAAEGAGAEALLAEVRDLLDGDLAVGNLESPFGEGGAAAREGPYRLVAPPALAAALPAAGLDAVSLANNHGLDAGPAGLADTAAALAAAAVAPVGAGESEAAALAPVTLEARGLRVAVLALNDVLDPADGGAGLAPAGDAGWPSPDFAACSPGGACPHGRAWLSARAVDAVAAARADADAVVVLAHWGLEYAPEPSVRQRAWAARLVAAGADLVVGAHPHVLQPAELVEAGGRAGFVAYSLGNFLFDGPADPALSSGAALRVLIDRDGVALVGAAPVATAGGRPRPLDAGSAPWRQALAALGAPEPVGPAPAASPAPATSGSAGPAPDPPAAAAGAAPPARQPADMAAAAWRWDGAAGLPLAAPAGLALPAPAVAVAADLRGDGEPLWATLDPAGVVTLRDGPGPGAAVVWSNERPEWRFTRLLAGDPNDDGRAELLLLLEQPDETGLARTQPYLLGWRGGRFRIIWGGSATAAPIRDLAWADLDGDGRGELVVLEGDQPEGPPAGGDGGARVAVYRWHGWGFQREWRSPPGPWRAVGLRDLDGDGAPEIVAVP